MKELAFIEIFDLHFHFFRRLDPLCTLSSSFFFVGKTLLIGLEVNILVNLRPDLAMILILAANQFCTLLYNLVS